MVRVWHINPLLFATAVLADYYIDNASNSVTYSMAPSQSGQDGWRMFSVSTRSLALSFSNSTGNYSITLDASHCYDENYALGVCGTTDSCYVQIPFIGSGITMYVFNAGTSGMTASFSVDGGTAVPSTIQAPPPPTYQASNVSLYDIQGLTSGNHTMVMTVLDWNGAATSMKFDYALVNETLVAAAATTSSAPNTASTVASSTSQTPTQTSVGNSSASKGVSVGYVVGGVLGSVSLLASIAIGFFCWRRRKASRGEDTVAGSTMQIDPFRSDYYDDATPRPTPYAPQQSFFAQHPEAGTPIPLLERSAMRSQVATAFPSRSGIPCLSSLGRAPSPCNRCVGDRRSPSRTSHVADAGSAVSDSQTAPSRHSLTAEQPEAIYRLRTEKVPMETIARVAEGPVSSRVLTAETTRGRRAESVYSSQPPPSYQTRDGRPSKLAWPIA